MVIPPTVGRVMWFYKYVEGQGHKGPLAATVAAVHSPTCINIGYLDQQGTASSQTSVAVVQEGEPVPNADYVTWMPYQIGQAKKNDAPTIADKVDNPTKL